MELLIGRVVKSHGIKGEVSVEVTTDSPETRFAVGEVLHGKQGKKEHELTIAAVCSSRLRKSRTARPRIPCVAPSSSPNLWMTQKTTASMTTSWKACASSLMAKTWAR